MSLAWFIQGNQILKLLNLILEVSCFTRSRNCILYWHILFFFGLEKKKKRKNMFSKRGFSPNSIGSYSNTTKILLVILLFSSYSSSSMHHWRKQEPLSLLSSSAAELMKAGLAAAAKKGKTFGVRWNLDFPAFCPLFCSYSVISEWTAGLENTIIHFTTQDYVFAT